MPFAGVGLSVCVREGEGRETVQRGRVCENDLERTCRYLSRDPGSRRLFNSKECAIRSPDGSVTRSCSLYRAVTSAGFECTKPAPKQNSLRWYRKGTLGFSKARKK